MAPQLNSEPLVSVIIPYYQHKNYIASCLDSIFKQTYPHIELIVIDDCSPDGSGEYVKQILENKDWIERFDNQVSFTSFPKNKGAHATINYGINKASGDFIFLVNSDDIYHYERIKIMVKAMQQEQKEFAFSGVSCIDDNGDDISQSDDWALTYAKIQNKIEEFPSLGFAALTGNSAISTGNFVFTKNLYRSTLGFRNLKYCHDWDFLLQCVRHTEPIFISEKLYYYRVHENNSFKSLQKEGVHISDTTFVLRHYFDSVRCQKTINPLAPSPFNWPGYFELFLTINNYEEHYQKSVFVNL